MEVNEYIVIGSGFCGVMAAKTLIDAGAKVVMLDAGIDSNTSVPTPNNNFIGIRRTDFNQADFFIGKAFEALANLQKKNPIHLTPGRTFTTDQAEVFLKWLEGDFNPIESLAKGGLGNGWGLGSYVYSDAELKATGLPVNAMKEAYKWVASYIGISGGNDASENYATAGLLKNQSPIPNDFNGLVLYQNSQNKKDSLLQLGFTAGRTPLAVSTDNDANGKSYSGDDLDFYTSGESSAYRPQKTLRELEKNPNFNYVNHQLALSFRQITSDCVEVETQHLVTGEKKHWHAKKLLLSGGALGTARIVMRSLQTDILPVICNPYSYIPSVQWPLIGAANTGYQTGLAQLSLYYDPKHTHTEVAMGSMYSYRSLLGFRLMKEFPFDSRNGHQFLKLLQPALNVTGLFHPEYGSETKYIERISDPTSPTADSMKSRYTLSDNELHQLAITEKAFRKALRLLGTIPLKVQRNGHGASIHYGGTIPYGATKTPSLRENGSLAGFSNVYVTDGSGFRFLSGKGLTLTLMAHAHLIAKNALENQ